MPHVYETLLTREELAVELGRHSATIRNWEKNGTITAEPKKRGKYKLYSLNKVLAAIGQNSLEKYSVIFMNSQTAEDKDQLEQQLNLSKQFCTANGWRFIALTDKDIDKDNTLALDTLMGVIFDKKIERLILPNNTSVSSNEFRLLKALCKAAKIPFITVEEKLVSCCTQMELVLKETKLSYPYEYKQCLTRLLNEQQ